MNANEILAELETYGNENIKKIFLKHGAREPFLGVKIEDLKKIQKRIKKNHELSLALYATGISDAMYLAGLIADEKQISKDELQKWAEQATWSMVSEYPVAQVAAESRHGWELAQTWIDSDKELIATAGWATLSFLVSVKPDEELNILKIESLLDRVKSEIHSAPNSVRYTMNGFVIAVGTYIAQLSKKALEISGQIGKVEVDMGETACKTPDAKTYIEKAVNAGKLGKKRKTRRG
jgi:3-methyladenine DNA glycosylase AlkD